MTASWSSRFETICCSGILMQIIIRYVTYHTVRVQIHEQKCFVKSIVQIHFSDAKNLGLLFITLFSTGAQSVDNLAIHNFLSATNANQVQKIGPDLDLINKITNNQVKTFWNFCNRFRSIGKPKQLMSLKIFNLYIIIVNDECANVFWQGLVLFCRSVFAREERA